MHAYAQMRWLCAMSNYAILYCPLSRSRFACEYILVLQIELIVIWEEKNDIWY